MDLLSAIENRASIRHFAPEPVPLEILQELVRRAGLSPSINNAQPWKFIAISNKELLGKMADAVQLKLATLFAVPKNPSDEVVKSTLEYFSTFFRDAPAVIAIGLKPYTAIIDRMLPVNDLDHDDINIMRNFPDVQSIGACIQTILLSAVDLGYGACWLSGLLVARAALEKLIGIQEPFRLAAVVAVGRQIAPVKQREKKKLSEIFEIIA